MSEQESNKKKGVLTFDGKKYFIDELSDEAKEIIRRLQIADAQIKMHEDTLKLISLGKNVLANDLRKNLEKKFKIIIPRESPEVRLSQDH
mgnify:CR=1 FL=1